MMIDISTLPALANAVSTLSKKHSSEPNAEEAGTVKTSQIIAALEQFQEVVRYLNTRRSTKTVLTLDSEAAVQDALYIMLRPWVLDLTPENPTDKVANRFTIKDFISPSAKTIIEVKYIRDASHGKNITKELHDDIETYRHNPTCRNLIFFIYDPDSLIPDQSALSKQIVVERIYDGVSLFCHLIVKP